MAAPLGNQFWKIAGDRIGRPKRFATPEDLWSECCDYFEWVDTNPLKEAKAFSYEGNITIAELPKMRAMTLTGLCLFLGIDEETWRNYRDKQEYFGVVSRAERIIRTQKFEGAAAELLNSNIIARDLGLADKKELSGPNGGPIETTETASAASVVASLLDGIRANAAAAEIEEKAGDDTAAG